MILDLLPLVELSLALAATYGLVFLRIGAMMMLVPGFGERSLPMRVRLSVALCFTVVIAPLVSPPDATQGLWSLVGLIACESLMGAFFGLLLRLFVHGLQTAGTIAAQSTSLSQIFGASAGIDAQPALSAALVLGGLCLAVIAGLHLKLVDYMVLTYELQPAGTLPSRADLMQVGLGTIARCFGLGMSLAAPFLIASLIYNVTLGFINKAMPQLMVSFIGAPAATFAGLALLALAGPVILWQWVEAMDGFMLAPGANP